MEKIKHFIESEKGKDILVVLIVILVGLGSFELGRLSKENSSGGIKINYKNNDLLDSVDQGASVISSEIADMSRGVVKTQNSGPETSLEISKNFFASNRGSKYYSLGCSAGKTIKQENRIYFTTGEEAQKAGYELSSSCQ